MTEQLASCPSCGSRKSVLENYARDVDFKGLSLYVENLVHCVCSNCGNIFESDAKHDANVAAIKAAFVKARAKHKRDHNLLDGHSIKTIRSKFDLTQREASLLFGGGANAFSKYENEEIIQSTAMDKLLRLVDLFGVNGVNALRSIQSGAFVPAHYETSSAAISVMATTSVRSFELPPVANAIPSHALVQASTGQKFFETPGYIANKATGALISISPQSRSE